MRFSSLCLLAASAACGSVSVGPAMAPEIPADCAKTGAQLGDDFDDPAVAPMWFPQADAPAMVAESGGEVVVTLAADQVPSTYASYYSLHQYDLVGSRLSVKVPTVPSP